MVPLDLPTLPYLLSAYQRLPRESDMDEDGGKSRQSAKLPGSADVEDRDYVHTAKGCQ